MPQDATLIERLGYLIIAAIIFEVVFFGLGGKLVGSKANPLGCLILMLIVFAALLIIGSTRV